MRVMLQIQSVRKMAVVVGSLSDGFKNILICLNLFLHQVVLFYHISFLFFFFFATGCAFTDE